MIQTFTVASAQPIAIYPAGLQQSVTVLNNGTATVYLGETASGTNGYPVAAGNSVQWNPSTPLYAYVVAGTSTELLINDAGTALPSANVGITGTVTADVTGTVNVVSDLVLLATVTGPASAATAVLDVRGYSSVVVMADAGPCPTGTAVGEIQVAWRTAAVGLNRYNIARIMTGVSNSSTMTETLSVRAGFLTVSFAYVPGSLNPWDSWSIRVFGSTAPLPESYQQAGMNRSGTVALKHESLSPGLTPAGAGSAAQYPGTIAGPATMTVRMGNVTNTGAGILCTLQTVGPSSRTIWARTVFSAEPYIAYNDRISLPLEPLVFTINNQTGIAQDMVATLTMEGSA